MKSISETGYSLKSSEPTNQPLVRNSTCNTLQKQYVINTNLFLFRLSTVLGIKNNHFKDETLFAKNKQLHNGFPNIWGLKFTGLWLMGPLSL